LNPEESLVTPSGYLAYLREQGVPASALEVAPLALLGWGGLSRDFALAAGARRRRRWPYDGDWPYHDADGFGIARLPTGGPAAAFLLDQLVAGGARVLVTAGICGSLAPDVPPGTVVVAGDAIAGDGTSAHYSPPGEGALPASPALVRILTGELAEAGVDTRVGTTWTTDAPFREVPTAVNTARNRGGQTVDMEAAAVYALAARREVAACSVLIVTDGVWERWHPAFGAPPVRRALTAVGRTLPAALARLADRPAAIRDRPSPSPRPRHRHA
jgi:uridine phosphorylase